MLEPEPTEVDVSFRVPQKLVATASMLLLFACGGSEPRPGEASADDGPDEDGSGQGGAGERSTEGEAEGGLEGEGASHEGLSPLGLPESNGGEAPSECATCTLCKCAAPYVSCTADAGCSAWDACGRQCFEADFSASCLEACDAAHPEAAALYEAVYGCLCDACAAECGFECAAGPEPPG